ncbi:MAG: XRE family transcriptional regulator [Tabrizicola sp.]|jgi:transcriptional regulator with XRE-family HTH domain|uniref:helix-turn-helix domain-containing protein n=1 Tax=Tabrizicola sp. TaxID=2005166 RepID=UPI003BB1A458
MAQPIISAKIGEALRQRRKRMKVTLQALAQRTDVTPGFLSQMERGLCSPSLSSLLRITQALDTTIEETLSIVSDGHAHLQEGKRALWGMGDAGRFYEKLGHGFEGATFYPSIVHRPSGHVSEHMKHPGEAFCYLMAGELEYHLGDEVFVVKPGDTVHHDTMVPHHSIVTSAGESVELWVTTLPSKFK